MYIGYDLQTAVPGYLIIDDISSGFNGSATSFALLVGGVKPTPMPASPQQVLISVNGVVQEPDPTGSAGFTITGDNIVFSSAPTNGHAFFGIVLAGADYANAGGEFPDGSLAAPSFTFSNDNDTGWYREGSGVVGFSANGTAVYTSDNDGITLKAQKDIRFGDSDSSNYIALQAPGTVGSNVTFTLPAADGSANQVLKTDASGNLTWTSDVVGNAATITVADESSDTSCNVLFTTAATGNLAAKSGTNLTFNSDTGALTATSFAGALTGNVTGNCSGSAATVTTAAQTAITSLGTLTGLTVSGYADFTGLLSEACTVTAGKLSDNTNLDLANGNVFLFTTQETTTCTPNLRWNGSTTLNSKVNVGDMIAITVITTAAAGGYSAQLTIDGAAVTENWVGGSAPSAGGSSGKDIYSYTIVKTADATFTVIGNLVKTSS